ncbi:hypothetical protein FRC18_001510 [Serendipita sp. 400]|nr:hypothetical protein FRC18_001510 [Serendipita sp. 400]
MVRSLLISTVAAALWLSISLGTTQAAPTIQTTSGKLKGNSISSTTNAYLGVPFAAPPVGPLRFLAPKALNTPNVVRNTTSFSAACVQFNSFYPPSPTGESEDCLYLNVWTSPNTTSPAPNPALSDASASSDCSGNLKPVMIWFYGGGWNSGGSSFSLNDLTLWATAHPEIVFVSVNYRLNIFGYPNSPGISSANTNAGLRDQRLAIEWVSKNIANFGGDPARIVLGGQSAGAGSISGYLYAYPSNSLIKGAILMSGQAPLAITPPPVPIPGLPIATNPFQNISSAAGCALQGSKYGAQLDCLRQKTSTELIATMTQLNVLGIGPLIDNQLVFSVADYKSKGKNGRFAKVPILTGTTDNEADIFLIDRTTNTLNTTLSETFTLSIFRCFDSWQSSYSSSAGVPTYRYRYLGIFPSLSPPPLRAWHASDQVILFGGIPTEPEASATTYLQKAWSTFIVDPSNGLKQLGWPTYKGYSGKTLVDIFKNNNVQGNPIQTENPTAFDSGCAALGLGL